LDPANRNLYQSFWINYGANSANGQLKTVQYHGNSGVGDFAPGAFFGASGQASGGGALQVALETGDLPAHFGPGPSFQVWQHVEMLMQQSSAANVADGRLRVRLDNQVIYDLQNIVTRTTNAGYVETSFGHGCTNYTSFPTVSLDETYLQQTLSRVELGNASTYAACTLRVPQLVTAWSTTSVSYTCVKGALASGAVWEYVIDDTDTVRNTRQLTLA